MNIAEIINKKANNETLASDEIKFIIKGIDDYVSDYQLSAFLMSMKINKLNKEELFSYVDSIVNSGKSLPLDENKVDKHSTGGSGDKITLILLPFLVLKNIKFTKFSGKGLGYTGGTLDKLNSIKNFRVNYTYEELLNSASSLILSSSSEFVPADKKTYEIRDTSGSVDSWDLIAASIFSKKIISGAKNILIDLKVGTGSFIKNIDEAEMLASKLKSIASNYGRHIYILFTKMDEPLGWTVGNSIEIHEAIEFLNNKENNREPNLEKLVEKIVSLLYSKALKISYQEANDAYKDALNSGKAFNAFLDLIKNQGGNIDDLKNNTNFKPNFSYDFKSSKDGYITFNDVSKLGYFLINIKAGRHEKTDELYYHSGIRFYYKKGAYVKQGDTLFTVYSEKELTNDQKEQLNDIISILNSKIEISNIIIKEILWE